MKLAFENLGTNTYLVYGVDPADEVDTMSLGMLTNNSIPGFAAASFMQMDMTKYIKYNVSAKISVRQLFSGPVNKKRLLGVFNGVVDAMLSAEDYMLDPASILLDLDYIFTDVSTAETELVCLPILNLQQQTNLNMFFKNILFTTQFDQTENCDHVAMLINFLNNNPNLILSDFKAMLQDMSQTTVQRPVVSAPVQQPVVSAPVQQPVVSAPVQQPAVSAPVQPVTPQQTPVAPVVQATPVAAVQTIPVATVAPQSRQNPGVKIPGGQTAVPQSQATKPEKKEKGMSLLYLMQHYNKENAAIYKAQQEAAKAQKSAPVAPQPKVAQPKVAQPKVAQPKVAKSDFAIPGQSPAGFAIPGQQAAVVTPVKVAPQPQPATPKAVPEQPAYQQPVYQQPVQQATPQPSMGVPLNFGETTVLSAGAIGETTVLSNAAAPVKNEPHLIRTKNNEKIPLNKPVFRIGKERSYVDYFIGDNTAISRSHANIVNHDGEFYVVDTNSTNHTYVNGGMIQSNEEVKLSHGTKIRLANEDFEFKMY